MSSDELPSSEDVADYCRIEIRKEHGGYSRLLLMLHSDNVSLMCKLELLRALRELGVLPGASVSSVTRAWRLGIAECKKGNHSFDGDGRCLRRGCGIFDIRAREAAKAIEREVNRNPPPKFPLGDL